MSVSKLVVGMGVVVFLGISSVGHDADAESAPELSTPDSCQAPCSIDPIKGKRFGRSRQFHIEVDADNGYSQDYFFSTNEGRFTIDINPISETFAPGTYIVTAHVTDCEFPGCESDVIAGTSFEVF